MNKDKYLKYKRKYLKLKEFILRGGNTAPGFYNQKQMSPASRRGEEKDSQENAEKQNDDALKKLVPYKHHQNNSNGPHVSAAISTNPKDIEEARLKLITREREEKEAIGKANEWNQKSLIDKAAYVIGKAVGAVVRAITPTGRR